VKLLALRPWVSRTLVACLLLTWLAGCSSTQFFYNRLDFFVPWYLGDYVSLDRSQDALLEEELQPFLAWHRQDELPRYIELLDRAERSLDQPVTRDQLAALTLDAEQALDRLQHRALDWMLVLGDALREEQLQEFMLALREQQAEYEEKYLERDDAHYRDDACERLQDNIRRYLGRLQTEQKTRLAVACANLRRSDSVWLAERAAWLERLDVLLQRAPDWQASLRQAVAQRRQSVSIEYRTIWDANTEVIQLAVIDLVNTRTERQDAHLRRELGKLREDLMALVEQGPADGSLVATTADED
jgi:hypothetical protein